MSIGEYCHSFLGGFINGRTELFLLVDGFIIDLQLKHSVFPNKRHTHPHRQSCDHKAALTLELVCFWWEKGIQWPHTLVGVLGRSLCAGS